MEEEKGWRKEIMLAKTKTPEQKLKALRKDIRQEIAHWEDINLNGCSDPFWSDGCNMNLTRDHIIYAKRQIAETCAEHDIPIPEEMYLPTPPEVSEYYMANLKHKRRVEMIGHRDKIVTKRNRYDRDQLSLF